MFTNFHWPSFTLRGNTAAAHNAYAALSPGPHPVPENLCKLRSILADIIYAVNGSPFVQAQTKQRLATLLGQLDAECSQIVTLTRLAQRAASESANVLLSRIRFFEALDERIRQISALRERFVDSRITFRERPTRLLAGRIRDARGHAHEGMFSDLRPLFDQIDGYYREVNVSLLAEERHLKAIRRSLRVTPDDRLRWEHIRDACREASGLLTAEDSPSQTRTQSSRSSSFAPSDTPSPPSVSHTGTPHRRSSFAPSDRTPLQSVHHAGTPQPQPQPINPDNNNKSASNMRALAQTVAAARDRLRQTHENIMPLTHHPQTDLLRLMSEYENGEKTCRQRIGEVLEFSERFIHSFAEVPPLDDFRDHLLPVAAASSSRVLQDIAAGLRSTMSAVQSSLPRPADHFIRFEHYLPLADRSMQNVYQSLHGLVLPLEQPEDPRQGVLRPLTRVQLREEQQIWRGLEEQWAHQIHQHRRSSTH